MSLIYGVPEMAEEEVLEQIAFQAVQYLRLDDPKYKKADTLSKILVAAKDKPKEDEIVYIEALESYWREWFLQRFGRCKNCR